MFSWLLQEFDIWWHRDYRRLLEPSRSSQWPKVRKDFLSKNPNCTVCGGTANLEAHHKMPFHLDRSKELDENNLMPLCEAKRNGVNCHLLFGHLGNFKTYNPNVDTDVKIWNDKIINRDKNIPISR